MNKTQIRLRKKLEEKKQEEKKQEEQKFSMPHNNINTVYRQMTETLFKNRTDKHCVICGDNEEDGPIVTVTLIDDSQKTLCEMCHSIQLNMM